MPLDNERSRVAHLLRRAGFGASEAELDHYTRLGFQGALERLLNPEQAQPDDSVADQPPPFALDPTDREALPLVVMPRDRCWPLREELPLQRLSDTLILNELYRYYGVYRYAPGGQPAGCLPASGPTPGD